MQEQRKAYKLFRTGVVALSAVMCLIVFIASDPTHNSWSRFILFLSVAVVCELAPVDLGRDYTQFSLTLPVIIMVMMYYGPLPAIAISGLSYVIAHSISRVSASIAKKYSVSGDDGRAMLRLRKFIFGEVLPCIGHPWMERGGYSPWWFVQTLIHNVSHNLFSTTVAALAYVLAGGTLLRPDNASSVAGFYWMRTLGAAGASLLAWFVVDVLVYVVACVLYENLPAYVRTWDGFLLRCSIKMRQALPEFGRGYVVVGIMAALLVYLYLQIGSLAIFVLFAPFYMFRDAAKQTAEQVRTYRDTITALGTYMQRYHPYTRGHLKRVADLSERLAKELKLGPDSVMLMPDAGMLHDIGKVGVSEDILDKVGKLTDEEWDTIKSHPVKGAEIVSNIPYLEKIVDWVKYHHKWADGSGYPDDGVKEEQIPLEAAIIAVVDAFDAMTDDRDMSTDWVCDSCGFAPENGDRPDTCPSCGVQKKRVYRQPLSLDEAVDQLRRGAGTQFSPDVVKAFLRMLDRDGVHMHA